MAEHILELLSENGGGIETKTAGGETWLSWYTADNRMLGVVSNTPATRRWLRNTLRQMEKTATEEKNESERS